MNLFFCFCNPWLPQLNYFPSCPAKSKRPDDPTDPFVALKKPLPGTYVNPGDAGIAEPFLSFFSLSPISLHFSSLSSL